MKQFVIALGLAALVTGTVVGIGAPDNARADIVDDVKEACAGARVGDDWRVGAGCDDVAKAWKRTFKQILNGGGNYFEECLNEGCAREEVKELHGSYKEEMIGESGGKFEEAVELGVGIWAEFMSSQEEAIGTLMMLSDFAGRGWSVRDKDVRTAQERAWGWSVM